MRRRDLLGYSGIVILLAALVIRLAVLNAESLALGVAVAGIVLLLAYFFQAGSEVQGFLSRRSTREGGGVLGTTVFVIGILILVNLMGARMRVFKDITGDRLFSLSPETLSALEQAPEPPVVHVFHREGSPEQTALVALLEAVKLENTRFSFEVVDPDRDPARAVRFDLSSYGSVVEVGERQTIFTGTTEEEFVAALGRVSRERAPTVGFLNGHGEAYFSDKDAAGAIQAASILDRRGYTVRGVNLLRASAALVGLIDVLVVAGPRAELSAAEVDSVSAFVRSGGRVLVYLDPADEVTLDPILALFDLRFAPRFIDDPDQNDPQIILPVDFSGHPVVADLRNRRLSPVLHGVGEFSRSQTPLVRTATLMRSGPRSLWAGAAEDLPRRRALAVAAEREGESDGQVARLVGVGDRDAVTNRLFSTLGNADLFLSAVRWLSETDAVVSITPKERKSRPVVITRQQGRALMALFVFIVPVAVLVAGAGVWWKRR